MEIISKAYLFTHFPTDGETGKRKYLDWRSLGTSGIKNSVKPNTNNPWNEYNRISGVLSDPRNGNNMSPAEAQALYTQWTEKYLDHYADVRVYKAANPSSFTRTETENLFTPMAFAKKQMLAHIIMPPTEISEGRFIEWHSCKGPSHGQCYDVYNIDKTDDNGTNFRAVDLIVTPVGTSYNVKFKVKYTGKEKIELEYPSIDEFKVSLNGSPIYYETSSKFGLVWKAGEEFVIDLGDVDIGTTIGPTDTLRFYAEFNFDEAIKETRYSDNFAWKEIKGKAPQICPFAGTGEVKKYENEICVRMETIHYSYTGGDGKTYSGSYQQCAEYKCQVNMYSLAYTIDTVDDPSRADLMGMWSGNYYGHKNLSVTYATESEPSAEKWKKKITSHKVPGIEQNKLKRVIRAGRSLQLYGTLKFEVRFESFTGEGDLNSKVNKFVESLKKNLEVHGEDMGDGVVTNNLKKTQDTGQLDSSRAKVNGKYIKYKDEPMQTVRLGYAGRLGCKEIDVYSKEYSFEIPIKSKNLSGEQKTSSLGDYKTSKSYQVQSKDTDYYTNVNTFNGVHSLKAQLKIVGSDIDSAMGNSKLCYTTPEVFGIYGNIYDDVRVDDITDQVKGKDKFDW